jgi:hypothetical protein
MSHFRFSEAPKSSSALVHRSTPPRPPQAAHEDRKRPHVLLRTCLAEEPVPPRGPREAEAPLWRPAAAPAVARQTNWVAICLEKLQRQMAQSRESAASGLSNLAGCQPPAVTLRAQASQSNSATMLDADADPIVGYRKRFREADDDSAVMWFDTSGPLQSILWGEDESPGPLGDPGTADPAEKAVARTMQRSHPAQTPTSWSASTGAYFSLPPVALSSALPVFKSGAPARALAAYAASAQPPGKGNESVGSSNSCALDDCAWQAFFCTPSGTAVELLRQHSGEAVHEPEMLQAAAQAVVMLALPSTDRHAILHTPFAVGLTWAGSPSQYTPQRLRELRRGRTVTLLLSASTPPLHFVRRAAAVSEHPFLPHHALVQDHGALISPLGGVQTSSYTSLKRHTTLRGPAVGVSGAAAARTRSSANSQLLQARHLEDLSCRPSRGSDPGGLVLLEYSEQQPMLLAAPGMGSRLLLFRGAPLAAAGADPAAAVGLASGSGEGSTAPVKLSGIADSGSPYPLLGGLAAAGGRSVAVWDSPLFCAAAFQHAPVHNDFLAVLRFEHARRGASFAVGNSGGRHLVAYLRELPPLLVVGISTRPPLPCSFLPTSASVLI